MTFEGTIRLDIIDEDQDSQRLIEFLNKYQKVVVYKEISSKTKKLHYQGVIWHVDEKAFNACKTRFTTMFKDTHPQSKKSMAKVKKETYKAYISKDGNLFFSKGVSEEELSDWQSQSYQPNLASEQKKSLTWTEKVLEAYDKSMRWIPDPLCPNESIIGQYQTATEVIEFVMCQLGDLHKPFSERIVTDMVNLIMQTRSNTINPRIRQEWKTRFINKVMNNLNV